MSDKKYKELSKRLDATSNKKRGGNFRSYEKARNDMRSEEYRKSERADATGRTNKRDAKKSKGFNYNFLKSLMVSVVPFVIVIVLVILGIYALTNKNATEISVNSEVIGQTKTTKLTKEEFLATLTAKLEQLEDTKIMLTDDVELTLVHGKKKLLKEDSQLLNLMADIVSYKVLAAEITVDGKKVGIAKNQSEAERIFNAVMSQYIPLSDSITGTFIQDVKAADNYVTKDKIDDSDTIRAELLKTTTQQTEYVVVEGDVLSRIAASHGISVNDLKDQNPELDVTKPLQIGTKLNITSTVPFVSVMTTENKVEEVPIKMETKEERDPTLPSGQRRIIQPGKDGKKEVVTQIIRINGVITSTSESTERIVEPSVTHIVAVGG